MPKVKTAKPSGAAVRSGRGLVLVAQIETTPAQRDRLKIAAVLAGDGSVAAFARRVVTEASEKVLKEKGL